jgi:hypothetical protein
VRPAVVEVIEAPLAVIRSPSRHHRPLPRIGAMHPSPSPPVHCTSGVHCTCRPGGFSPASSSDHPPPHRCSAPDIDRCDPPHTTGGAMHSSKSTAPLPLSTGALHLRCALHLPSRWLLTNLVERSPVSPQVLRAGHRSLRPASHDRRCNALFKVQCTPSTEPCSVVSIHSVASVIPSLTNSSRSAEVAASSRQWLAQVYISHTLATNRCSAGLSRGVNEPCNNREVSRATSKRGRVGSCRSLRVVNVSSTRTRI